MRIHLAARCMVSVLAALLAGAGCASAQGRSAVATKQDKSAVAASSDAPARSLVTLAQIQPAPSAPLSTTVEPLAERAARRVDRAGELIAEQRYTEAALELERGLRYQPEHPQLQRILALLHWEAGNLERARKHAEQAIAGNANNALAHYVRGRVMAREADLAGAVHAMRTALLCGDLGEFVGLNSLCHYYLAETLAAEGYWTAALEQYEQFERTRRSSPDVAPMLAQQVRATGDSAGLRRAELLEQLARYADAADVLGQLVAQRPDDGALRLRLGRVWHKAGNMDAALAAVASLSPEEPGLLDFLAEFRRASGHPERIVEDIRRLRERGEVGAEFIRQATKVLREAGSPQQAEELLREQLARQPDALELREELIDVLLSERAFESALEEAGRLVAASASAAMRVEARIAALAADDQACRALLDAPAATDNVMSTYLRGVLAEAAGRKELAASLFEKSLEADPNLVGPRVALARRYVEALRYEDALRVARVDSDKPAASRDARLEFVLASVYERLDQPAEAEIHFRNALQLDPEDVEVQFALAELYAQTDRPLNAQRQMQALVEAVPGHDRARERLALLYLEGDQAETAVQEFRVLKERAQSPNIRARATAFLSQYPRFDGERYRKALHEALGETPPDVISLLTMAESYNPMTESRERLDAYRRAVEADPRSERAVLGLVEALKRNLEFEAAMERLTALLPVRPNRHAWITALIELYWVVQDYDRAEALARGMLEKAWLSDADREGYRLRLVDSLRFSGRNEEAEGLMMTWSAGAGGPSWLRRLARLHVLQRKPQAAIPIYAKLLDSDEAERDIINDYLDALLAAEQYDQAAQLVLDRLADDPEDDEGVQRLVLVLSSAKRFDEALELTRNTILRTRHREAFQWLLAGVLQEAKQYTECVRWIESLMDEVLALMDRARQGRMDALDPSAPDRERLVRPDEPVSGRSLQERMFELRFLLASVLARSGEHRRLRSLVEDQWLVEPVDPGVRYDLLRALSLSFQMQGDDQASTERLAQALAINPGDVGLNNDVAYGWIDRGLRLEEAERMIRFALSQSPRQGAYLDTFGWLLYKKGEFAEAKKWLERAAKARSADDPVVHDHLGDACWRLGLRDEAQNHWRAAVESIEKMEEDDLISADLRRAKTQLPRKLAAAQAGEVPEVAPLGEGVDDPSVMEPKS